MKKKTLAILDHLPIIGEVIKMREEVVWWCSPFMEWYWNEPEAEPVRQWCKDHPDEVLTCKILRELSGKNK